MTEYLIPTGEAESEFTEKRSRFIGHIWRVESEEEARARIEETRKRHYDARHNCWCYRLRGGVERYSDDGEPQGTAGQPMLNVFQREQVEDVCCVVTRYFGGVLLGAGGLTRAYSRSAKDALDAAGISLFRRWVELSQTIPYALFERFKMEVEAQGGLLGQVDYGSQIDAHVLLPETEVEPFALRLTELTAGQAAPEVRGEAFRAVPLKREKK